MNAAERPESLDKWGQGGQSGSHQIDPHPFYEDQPGGICLFHIRMLQMRLLKANLQLGPFMTEQARTFLDIPSTCILRTFYLCGAFDRIG